MEERLELINQFVESMHTAIDSFNLLMQSENFVEAYDMLQNMSRAVYMVGIGVLCEVENQKIQAARNN